MGVGEVSTGVSVNVRAAASFQPSLRDSGHDCPIVPSVETLGYFRESLRDFSGWRSVLGASKTRDCAAGGVEYVGGDGLAATCGAGDCGRRGFWPALAAFSLASIFIRTRHALRLFRSGDEFAGQFHCF